MPFGGGREGLLARLLQLASPALPVGRLYLFAGPGMGVEAGTVKDEAGALAWIGDQLEWNVVRCEAPLGAHDRGLDSRRQREAALELDAHYLATAKPPSCVPRPCKWATRCSACCTNWVTFRYPLHCDRRRTSASARLQLCSASGRAQPPWRIPGRGAHGLALELGGKSDHGRAEGRAARTGCRPAPFAGNRQSRSRPVVVER